MAKRRTSGIQRRQRASTEALSRRLDAPRGGAPLDWRVLAIGGFLLFGVVLLVIVLLTTGGPNPHEGIAQADDGTGHIPSCQPGGYSSTPAVSGCHEDAPGNWGVYASPPRETQMIHNLEHGGIVIWYDDAELSQEQVDQLAGYVSAENRGNRYKVILAPRGSGDLDTPIVITAWRYLLELEEVDLDAIRGFTDAHYGDAPEPGGGPGPPA